MDRQLWQALQCCPGQGGKLGGQSLGCITKLRIISSRAIRRDDRSRVGWAVRYVNDFCFVLLSWLFSFVLQSDNGVVCLTKLELRMEFYRSLFVDAVLNYALRHTQYFFLPVDLMSLCMTGSVLRDTGLTIIARSSCLGMIQAPQLNLIRREDRLCISPLT
jgi:hypothetical protein